MPCLLRRPKTACVPPGAQIETTPTGRVARWTDATGKAQVAPMIGNHRIITAPGSWYVKFDDANGKRTSMALHTTDKRVADQMAAKIVSEAHNIRKGLIDPRAEKIRVESARPILTHLAEYRTALTNRGNKEAYIQDVYNMIKRLIKDMQAVRLLDLTDDGVIAAIVKMADDRRLVTNSKGEKLPPILISAGRRNAHIVAIKSFTAWAAASDRIYLDPLRKLAKCWNPETDRRLVRRELLPDELARLLQAARTGVKHHRLKGEERVILYTLAFTTGLRRGELESLTVGSFKLDAKHPVVVAKAGYTKNEEEAIQPLSPDVVAILRAFFGTKAKTTPLFPNLTTDTADMIRRDFAVARKAWIAEADEKDRASRAQDPDFLQAVDSEGRKVDFHGSRHSFISSVVASGASVKVAQELARHSTPVLTIGLYSHTRIQDRVAHIPTLPTLAAGTLVAPAADPTGV